jgi:hypothetical protein
MADETLLVITGMGVPPYSARGLSQSLLPIDQADQSRRTVNGDLIDNSVVDFRKFRSVISCTDQDVPAINGIWPGAAVTVECVAELSYLTAGGSPDRAVVAGSSRVDGLYTFYRPQLSMLVTGFEISVDEYGAEIGWTLQLDEV